MTHFDVFNGDVDGICALHQLRLANPLVSDLITGVKRDTQLIDGLPAKAGDSITALDIGLKQNNTAVTRLLANGVRIRWIDHHNPGEIPDHPAFESSINTATDVCTSILVDRQLGGIYRPWAITAAFGDGLAGPARDLASGLNLTPSQTAGLSRLGELLNYNAYGETLADLWCQPKKLYSELHSFSDPWEFSAESDELACIENGFTEDIAKSGSLVPLLHRPGCSIWLLPDAPWSRRVSGVFATRQATLNRQQVLAVVTHSSDGEFLRVSLRVPAHEFSTTNLTTNADTFCQQFPTGGGRQTAAGINELPKGDFERFLRLFSEIYA